MTLSNITVMVFPIENTAVSIVCDYWNSLFHPEAKKLERKTTDAITNKLLLRKKDIKRS